MMNNPLDRGKPAIYGGGYFLGIKPGETRTDMVHRQFDERGRGVPDSLEPFTMTRTERDFIHDWVDCVSNEILRRKGVSGFRWVVINGEAHLLPTREAKRLERMG
jgi:hypothetical protein